MSRDNKEKKFNLGDFVCYYSLWNHDQCKPYTEQEYNERDKRRTKPSYASNFGIVVEITKGTYFNATEYRYKVKWLEGNETYPHMSVYRECELHKVEKNNER